MDAVAERTGYRTKAQEEILAYLKSTPGVHHTALEIRKHFAQAGMPIGTATVYRQLERFVNEGQIQKYFLETGESACYAFSDSPKQCHVHFHCRCEQCGCLIHLDCEKLRAIQNHLLEHHGFAWNAGKTVFYGLCEQCRDKT